MDPPAATPSTPAATLTPAGPGAWTLGGAWTLQGLGPLARGGEGGLPEQAGPQATVLDGAAIAGMDSTGAWILQRWLRGPGADVPVASGVRRAWPARAQRLMEAIETEVPAAAERVPRPGLRERTGRGAVAAARQALAFLAFVGEVALAGVRALRRPRRQYWRAAARELGIGGYDALPIIGLTAFLLGIVVAYQGADQLRHYGANIFVVELVGYAMLREFSPLICAIIVAGRSGSAYAAQIGTMVVNEEIDALRTLGIDPLQRLVLPRLAALLVALPLLTLFADIAGVLGGMAMARSQLGIGFAEFADRFGRVMQGSALLVGIGKSLVFAVIIVLVGCFQGLRAGGSADSVGRQTTSSVVQGIFLVIVADALFSVAFNVLGL